MHLPWEYTDEELDARFVKENPAAPPLPPRTGADAERSRRETAARDRRRLEPAVSALRPVFPAREPATIGPGTYTHAASEEGLMESVAAKCAVDAALAAALTLSVPPSLTAGVQGGAANSESVDVVVREWENFTLELSRPQALLRTETLQLLATAPPEFTSQETRPVIAALLAASYRGHAAASSLFSRLLDKFPVQRGAAMDGNPNVWGAAPSTQAPSLASAPASSSPAEMLSASGSELVDEALASLFRTRYVTGTAGVEVARALTASSPSGPPTELFQRTESVLLATSPVWRRTIARLSMALPDDVTLGALTRATAALGFVRDVGAAPSAATSLGTLQGLTAAALEAALEQSGDSDEVGAPLYRGLDSDDVALLCTTEFGALFALRATAAAAETAAARSTPDAAYVAGKLHQRIGYEILLRSAARDGAPLGAALSTAPLPRGSLLAHDDGGDDDGGLTSEAPLTSSLPGVWEAASRLRALSLSAWDDEHDDTVAGAGAAAAAEAGSAVGGAAQSGSSSSGSGGRCLGLRRDMFPTDSRIAAASAAAAARAKSVLAAAAVAAAARSADAATGSADDAARAGAAVEAVLHTEAEAARTAAGAARTASRAVVVEVVAALRDLAPYMMPPQQEEAIVAETDEAERRLLQLQLEAGRDAEEEDAIRDRLAGTAMLLPAISFIAALLGTADVLALLLHVAFHPGVALDDLPTTVAASGGGGDASVPAASVAEVICSALAWGLTQASWEPPLRRAAASANWPALMGRSPLPKGLLTTALPTSAAATAWCAALGEALRAAVVAVKPGGPLGAQAVLAIAGGRGVHAARGASGHGSKADPNSAGSAASALARLLGHASAFPAVACGTLHWAQASLLSPAMPEDDPRCMDAVAVGSRIAVALTTVWPTLGPQALSLLRHGLLLAPAVMDSAALALFREGLSERIAELVIVLASRGAPLTALSMLEYVAVAAEEVAGTSSSRVGVSAGGGWDNRTLTRFIEAVVPALSPPYSLRSALAVVRIIVATQSSTKAAARGAAEHAHDPTSAKLTALLAAMAPNLQALVAGGTGGASGSASASSTGSGPADGASTTSDAQSRLRARVETLRALLGGGPA